MNVPTVLNNGKVSPRFHQGFTPNTMTSEQIAAKYYPTELKRILQTISTALKNTGADTGLAFQITEAIRKECGGVTLYIPNGKTFDRILRDNTIKQQRANGMTINQIARNHRLTDRQVFNILKNG